MRMTAKQVGNYGEAVAEKYLKKRFWRIVSRIITSAAAR